MFPTPRRWGGLAALTLTATLLSVPSAASAAPSPFGPTFARLFAAPPSEARPKTRYWWPCGQVDPASIDTEMKQIADRGFGSVEIQCMFTTDPAKYGWGGPEFTDRLEKAAAAGRKHGLDVDLTVGPSWPLVVPGLTPDSPQAAQELAYGRAVVEGGSAYDGPVPAAPAPREGVTEQTLVTVQAARCPDGCTTAKPVKLDKDSLVDLTAKVRDGRVSWTAPAGGQWLLLGHWRRGTGQAPVSGQSVSGRPAYVVDHFGASGARAATGHLDAHVLSPKLRELLRSTGGDLFEDSLELDSAQHWTANLPDRFRDLRGYSLRENLPVLFIDKIHRQYTSAKPTDTPDFEFTDGSGARVRDDYYRTLTDLYVDRHVKPLKKWANSLGLRFRAQPYGTTIDTPRVDAAVDVPETESLGFHDGHVDEPFRWVADGAVHLSGKDVYSLECCAVFNSAYAQTWPQMLRHFNTAFAHDVNQVVFHGVPTENALGIPWPGFSPFTMQGGNGFSEAWGPRQPTWDDTDEVTGWTARMQYVLRQGRPSVDLAVYRQSHGSDVREPEGVPGFTLDFTGPDQLAGTSVRGRRLAPDGPAYRALVLDRQPTLGLDTARTLLSHARRGLPIVVVGEPPARTPGAHRAADQDAELGRLMQRLLAQPSVRRVSAPGELGSSLAALGVRSSAESSAPGLLTVRRAVNGGNLYYLYNPTSAAVSAEVSLEGEGRPFSLDAWTGKISPLGRYRTEKARTVVPVSLAPGASTVIALGGGEGRHVISVDGGEVVANDGLHLRATTGGTYTARLNDGTTAQIALPEVAPEQRLDSWKLTVDDWRRGADGRRETVRHELDLPSLKPWSDIPELADSSGIGTYSTTVTLGDLDGAYLELGEVTDTFQISVNGRALPPSDQVTRRVDLAGHLEPGTNTITIRVATTLRNRLRVTPDLPLQAQQPRQRYGLIGPVRLLPYREAPIQD
ncbi:glycosyl hydrolase [Actinocorallia populi]|uniref:glycosyl hydrolase n=1 Tax=Actinocorallia populi TaxID=2079200 RepID=UPI000D0977D6|nr:glycosyl hydrolase [Actinocorallia populi]